MNYFFLSGKIKIYSTAIKGTIMQMENVHLNIYNKSWKVIVVK